MSFKRLLSDVLNNGSEEKCNQNKISKRKPREKRMKRIHAEDAYESVVEHYSLDLGI